MATFSPDLSPIEQLWDQIGQVVRRRQPLPVTLCHFQIALREEWKNITQHRVQRLVR